MNPFVSDFDRSSRHQTGFSNKNKSFLCSISFFYNIPFKHVWFDYRLRYPLYFIYLHTNWHYTILIKKFYYWTSKKLYNSWISYEGTSKRIVAIVAFDLWATTVVGPASYCIAMSLFDPLGYCVPPSNHNSVLPASVGWSDVGCLVVSRMLLCEYLFVFLLVIVHAEIKLFFFYCKECLSAMTVSGLGDQINRYKITKG